MAEARAHPEPEMSGWLFKWTNYLKGYQRRWFVLSNGLLSYYRNQAEMAHTCRGTISLHGALIHTEESCNFVISNGGTQTFHIRAANEVERQRWVTALELAKDRAIRAIESEEDEEDYEDGDKCEILTTLKNLATRLEDIQTCNELINKHGTALQRSLSELEGIDSAQDASAKIKAINERATLFRITSNAMINACTEYLNLAQIQSKKWQKMLQHERSQKHRLEEMVETLARQHSVLEEAAKDHRLPKTSSPSDDDEENTEFYECEESGHSSDSSNLVIKIANVQRKPSALNVPNKNSTESHSESGSEVEDQVETEAVVISEPGEDNNFVARVCKTDQTDSVVRTVMSKRVRRTRVPNKPYYPLNLWSIMKNCIGKELSKIPMPVNFSEPLSMLQRLTEDYEYAHILDAAGDIDDPAEQLAYVAAFTVSSYSTTANRTGKPFNPLLGETYECDRTDDLGWKAVSEQVSHHPPMVAQHCEGRRWKGFQEFTMSSKFRGKYLQVVPLGSSHLTFDNGNHYTWRKVTTTIHNIIVGKLWVDQHGEMDITCPTNGYKCHLSYIPYSYFNREAQRKVKGYVSNDKGEVLWIVNGTWDAKIEIAPVTSVEGSTENPIYKTGPFRVVWQRAMPPPDSDKFYNFTLLACQLNEKEDGTAPTDSRNRPDQRLMEEGFWDEANTAKIALEEKQRTVRRQREAEAEEAALRGRPYETYSPVWFKKAKEPFTGNVLHIYQGDYWSCKERQDWSRCPNIF
uniref:Oxysterol-binding protein 1 n=1 Tax=Lygus hesperus TaxID=30085 RepID=A0A0A9W5Q0_LYGHE